jgi:endo-1,4-beta-xylanase
MKHRLLLALVVFVLVSLFSIAKVSSIPAAPELSSASTVEISSSTSLRSLGQKRGIEMGTAVEMAPFYKDANYRAVLTREFSILAPENAFKFASIHPTRDGYNFTETDTLVAFAKAHNMKVRAHPLVWHDSLPNWLYDNEFTREELLAILKDHIQTLVSRYRGQIYAWDVVSEAINRDGSLRDTLWLRHIGPEYIELAFRWTHEADPNARLFYTDYANEERGRKPDAMYALMASLRQRGIPIHGVGFQSHRWLDGPPKLDALVENMTRLKNLGLEVQFTEVDVQIQRGTFGSWEERLVAQAEAYGTMLKACVITKNCTAFVVWGFTDRYSWIAGLTGNLDAPLIFDESYRPKPAYYALQKVLNSEF